MLQDALIRSDIDGVPVRRGKVRDVFDFGDRLLIVATDRISAFDWVLPTGVPDKGRILTRISTAWFRRLGVRNHLLSTDPAELLPDRDLSAFVGRSMVVRKAAVVPIECVVRGYLAGGGWTDYRETGAVCGHALPAGLLSCQKLETPIFTPATKSDAGHDVNISFEEMVGQVGRELAERLRKLSIDVYTLGSEYAARRGIILADTKFEFGIDGSGEVMLVDEVLTPDSSRYWPAESYRPGSNPPSYDKQFVRDWLERSGWDKNSPPPALPEDVVLMTREKYLEAEMRLESAAVPDSSLDRV